MNFQIIELPSGPVAELTSKEQVIGSASDGLDLLGNAYYQGAESIVMYTHQLSPDFFDLKTGMAGEILQKFSNYRMRLAVVGDFSVYTGKAIRDFIYESNTMGRIHFVADRDEALAALS